MFDVKKILELKEARENYQKKAASIDAKIDLLNKKKELLYQLEVESLIKDCQHNLIVAWNDGFGYCLCCNQVLSANEIDIENILLCSKTKLVDDVFDSSRELHTIQNKVLSILINNPEITLDELRNLIEENTIENKR